MTPAEARDLKPGDRLVYDHPDAGDQPCEVVAVKDNGIRIRWPEDGGLWFGPAENELMARFRRAAGEGEERP